MIHRTLRKATIGALVGLVGGAWACSGLSLAMGAPIAGCACITITLAFGLLGALAGAACEEF
jgi:hypothetical protein